MLEHDGDVFADLGGDGLLGKVVHPLMGKGNGEEGHAGQVGVYHHLIVSSTLQSCVHHMPKLERLGSGSDAPLAGTQNLSPRRHRMTTIDAPLPLLP